MSSESEIPVLQDLLFKGQSDTRNKQPEYSVDENKDVEIEQDEPNSEADNEQQIQHEEKPEELISDKEMPEELSEELLSELPDDIESSDQQRMIEEEIQRIMQKHMDKAYRQIKKLLKDKIS